MFQVTLYIDDVPMARSHPFPDTLITNGAAIALSEQDVKLAPLVKPLKKCEVKVCISHIGDTDA